MTVTKRRRLLLWEGVRIHLDEVEGLGSYLELEAVAEAGPDSDLSAERDKVERLRAELGIEDERPDRDELLRPAPRARRMTRAPRMT